MKRVPTRRLLIQPSVQLSWFRQHGELEFVLPAEIQDRFHNTWLSYKASGLPTLPKFIADHHLPDVAFHEDDVLFALMVGADGIETELGPLDILCHQPDLIWRLARR